MNKEKPVSLQRASVAQSEAGRGMPVKTSHTQWSRPGRAEAPAPLEDVNTATPPDWPERFEAAAVLKGYLDGLADTPNHTRNDEAYWYGHQNALADRQPGQGSEVDQAHTELCH